MLCKHLPFTLHPFLPSTLLQQRAFPDPPPPDIPLYFLRSLVSFPSSSPLTSYPYSLPFLLTHYYSYHSLIASNNSFTLKYSVLTDLYLPFGLNALKPPYPFTNPCFAPIHSPSLPLSLPYYPKVLYGFWLVAQLINDSLPFPLICYPIVLYDL